MQVDIVKQAREAAGLNKNQLAALAGVPASTVSRIESGAIDPTLGMLDRLLRAAGYVPNIELARGSDPIVAACARVILTGQEFEALNNTEISSRLDQVAKSWIAQRFLNPDRTLSAAPRELAREAGRRSELPLRPNVRAYRLGLNWVATASRIDATKTKWASTGAKAAQRLGASGEGVSPAIFYVENIDLAERVLKAQPIERGDSCDTLLIPFDGFSEVGAWRDNDGLWWADPMQVVIDCYGMNDDSISMADQIADEWDRLDESEVS